jgi:predicted Zn finger-like uncharacterized protein
MKIVCDSCGAEYAIADEKVRGKVFKIRCKKCSTVIVVRGLSGESDAAEELSQPETRTYGYDEQDGAEGASGEAVWHLVIDQDQIGPISEQEVRQRFARGEVDLETYAWREGFGDWAALGTIDAFVGLASGQAAGAGMGDMAAGGADPDSATMAGDPFAGAADQGDGSDLFGSGGNAGDGLFAGAAAGGAADRRMRGERNENSVLFSLNNLAALASDSPKMQPLAAANSPGGGGGGGGGGMAQVGGSEGSGLIDIRSMAQTYMGGRDRGGAGQANPLGAFGAVEPVSFSAQSPMLLPQAPMNSGGANKTLYALIAGLGALLIIGVVVVVMVVVKDDGPTVAADTPDPLAALPDTPGTDDPPGTDTPPVKPATPDTPPDTTAAAATDELDEPDDNADKPEQPSNDRRPAATRPRRDDPPKRPSESASATPPKPPAPSGGGGCLDEVGCLLADKPPACCSKYSGGGGGGGKKPSGGGGGSNANLPEKLDRGDITQGITKVRSSVTGCGSKGKGEVEVTVKVEGSGSVGSVTVKSAPNAALGTCVANAVKKAKFAKTQQGATFTYPFVF